MAKFECEKQESKTLVVKLNLPSTSKVANCQLLLLSFHYVSKENGI